MRFSSRRVPAGRGGEGGTPLPVPPGRFPAPPRFLLALLVAASVAVLLASPWLDERLVSCGWIAVAVGLLLVRDLRGCGGEASSLACVAAAALVGARWRRGAGGGESAVD